MLATFAKYNNNLNLFMKQMDVNPSVYSFTINAEGINENHDAFF